MQLKSENNLNDIKQEDCIDRPDLQHYVDNEEPFLVKDDNNLRIATYNILTSFAYQPKSDTTLENFRLSWQFRKDLVVELIKKLNLDVITLQEVSIEQYLFLKDKLPEFEIIGFAAYTGHALHEIAENEYVGEIVPILYRKDKIDCIDSQVFWLSATPDKVSTGWDASRPRIVTAGAFVNKLDGKRFIVGNTHYDHQGDKSLVLSGQVEAEQLEAFREKNQATDVIYTGDRNCFTDKERKGNEWYKNFKAQSGAEDTRLCSGYIGLGNTFLGYEPDGCKARYDEKLERYEPHNTLSLLFHKGTQYKVKETKCTAGEYEVHANDSAKFLTFFGKIKSPEKRQFASDHACLMTDLKPS